MVDLDGDLDGDLSAELGEDPGWAWRLRGWRWWAGIAVLTVVVLALAAVSSARGAGTPPDPRTVVRVEGDAANGFGIHRLDGSAVFPPTDSESIAECNEYDGVRQRVRCRVEVRTWYRELAEQQRSLAWALDQ